MKRPDGPPERYLAPMIGRRQEMQVLQQALQDLRARRQGRMIFLTGESGVGKSRLVMEFSRLVQAEAGTIFSGQCLTNQPVTAYWVFLDLLRNSLAIAVDTPPAQASRRLAEKVREWMGAQGSETLPYLEHFLSLPPSDPEVARKVEFLDPDRLRQRITQAVRGYLEALARLQPLVLVLEDLLEADEPSLDLLVSLIETMPESPWLIVAVSRPFLQGKLKRVRDAAMRRMGEACQNLYLPRLEPQECQAILDQFLGPSDLPERMRLDIIERSGGVPFYVEEIVRMLIDVGALRRTADGWQATGTANLERIGVPESLQSLIRWRFERLEPFQRQVLQAAAVIGKSFDCRILLDLLSPLESAALDEALAQLEQRGFLYEGPASGGQALEFRHNLSAEIVYDTLESEERLRLHGRLGQALESFFAAQLSTQIDLLAHHYSRSDQKAPALRYLAMAGQKTARRYINLLAREYYEKARDLLPQVPHEPHLAVDIYMGLGDVLLLVGEYEPARASFRQAQEAIASESKLHTLGQACALQRKLGATYERQGDFDQALSLLRLARELVEDPSRPFPAEEAQVLNDMGWIHFRLGMAAEAENELIHALSLAQQARRYDITASIYNRLGGIYWQKDDLEKATNFVQKSIALRAEIGDVVAVARSYNNLGLLDWKRGKWEHALDHFNHSLALHANSGDIEGIIDVHGNLGLLHLDRGEVEAARLHLEESLSKARQIGHNYIVAMTLMYFSRLHLTLEDWAAALETAGQSWRLFEAMGARDELIDVFTLHGLAYLGMGDLEQAAAWTEKSLALLPRNADGSPLLKSNEAGRLARLAGAVGLQRGDLEGAERWFNACVELFQRLGNTLEGARTMVAQASLAAARGDATAGRVLLNEARLMLASLGAELDLQRLEVVTATVG